MSKVREPMNGLTHCIGALLSVVGGIALLHSTLPQSTHIAAFSIYAGTMFLLYAVSTLYHWLLLSPSSIQRLRRIDHCMIFIYIAGSYTPICLIALRGPWGWSLLGCVWGFAAIGVLMKCFWMHAPRWLSTTIYLVMGWMVVVSAYPLAKKLPTGALLWLAAGGALYSIGAVFYARKWPQGTRLLGFHEIFHIFVMGGSLCHYIVMYCYLARMPLQ